MDSNNIFYDFEPLLWFGVFFLALLYAVWAITRAEKAGQVAKQEINEGWEP